MQRTLRLVRLLALVLPLLAGRCIPIDVVFGVPHSDGSLPVLILLQSGQDPATAVVRLDGTDVTGRFHPSRAKLIGSVPLPPPGLSSLVVSAVLPMHAIGTAGIRLSVSFPLKSPAPAPSLAGFDPGAVVGALPRTAWLRLRFASPLSAAAQEDPAFGVECDGATIARKAYRAGDGELILDPTPELPPHASCRVAWRGPSGSIVETRFETAADASTPARVLHDRDDLGLIAPYPDDYFSVADAGTRTGRRLSIPEPPYTGAVLQLYQSHVAVAATLDGFSRFSPTVIGFSHPIDATLMPSDAFAAQDPFAPVALFDVDPKSPDYGKRIPYEIHLRSDMGPSAEVEHSATLFPAIALRPRGHYALVVTRRLFADGDPGRPLEPSAFFQRALAPAASGDSAALVKTRATIAPVLDFLETVPAVPIARSDVALVLPISIRSDDDIPLDLLAVKEDTLARPPPALSVAQVTKKPDGGAVLSGTVSLPSYLDPLTNTFAHDPDTGRPVVQGMDDVPFVLRLPAASAPSPAPIVMYQHGTPGSANEVIGGGAYLTAAGFAVAGITDYPDRKFVGGIDSLPTILASLIEHRAYPDFDKQSGADMIGFLHALQGLGGTSWRPARAPQTPLLDPTRLLYAGISEGANHALRFLPYAPEVLAATAGQGGNRGPEAVLHNDGVYLDLIPFYEALVPGIRPLQTLVGFALSQQGEDADDPSSYARFAYRAPLAIQGLPGARAPSLLWMEAIGDRQVPNNATRAAANDLGIPSVRVLRQRSPVLTEIDAPLRANLAADRTVGHFQYDPATTPGCVVGTDPHFCPTDAPIAQQQRLHFYRTALDEAAPEIVDPIP